MAKRGCFGSQDFFRFVDIFHHMISLIFSRLNSVKGFKNFFQHQASYGIAPKLPIIIRAQQFPHSAKPLPPPFSPFFAPEEVVINGVVRPE